MPAWRMDDDRQIEAELQHQFDLLAWNYWTDFHQNSTKFFLVIALFFYCYWTNKMMMMMMMI